MLLIIRRSHFDREFSLRVNANQYNDFVDLFLSFGYLFAADYFLELVPLPTIISWIFDDARIFAANNNIL